MIDILASIVSVDPPSLLGWLVLAFAAGMYPIGIMLGSSCSPCCGPSNPCSLCTEGELPDTLTVTFSGLADKAPGPDLIALSFSACYGSGASAQVTAPGGDPATDKGPIGAVSLTNGGSGYAKLGRVAPTLTVSGGSGTGATFTPSLSTSQDGCKLDLWALASVAVTGGTDYVDGESLTITIAEGDTELSAASATVRTERSEPTLSLSGNAEATFTYTDLEDGTWEIASVTLADGGSGYQDSVQLELQLGTDDASEADAFVYGYTGRIAPTVGASVVYSTGSGATLTQQVTETTDGDGRAEWQTSGVTVTAAGTGYSVDDTIYGSVSDGQSVVEMVAVVASVNGAGGITAVTVTQAGRYYKSDGILDSVLVSYGGRYYKDTGEPTSVEVADGGTYYREDASVAPYVAAVTVGVSQAFPSTGTGASLTATVESDTSSANFGKVTGVGIGNGGNNYLAHELLDSCMSRFNGQSIVCVRSTSNPCVYLFECAGSNCAVESEVVAVEYRGSTTPLQVSLVYRLHNGLFSEGLPLLATIASGAMDADENVADCSSIDVTCTGGTGVPAGATATVTAGGTYEATDSCRAITDAELAQIQVTIEWDGLTWVATRSPYPPEIPCQNQPGSANWNPFAGHLFEGCGMAAFGGFQAGAQCEPFKFHVIQCNGGGLGVKGCDLRWSLADMACQYSEQVPSWPFTLVKFCGWRHKIVHVPIDADGYPSGEAVIVRDEALDTVVGTGCEYPGLPSVSFSRLP